MRHALLFLTYLCFTIALQAQSVIRGPYLQSGSPNSIIVKWRTDATTNGKVWIGNQPNNLNSSFTQSDFTNNHEVLIEGLTPNTKYFYAVGNNAGIIAGGDAEHYFITAPNTEEIKPFKAWILGDCGTANNDQRRVRDAYYNYIQGQETDMILLLGDNAYPDGTDYQYQNAIFQNMYEDILKRAPMYSCIGNHDFHSVDWYNLTGPYFDIFTFPTNGELGGVPSGTESYYSWDYANIHFISLDSHASGRDPGDPMLVWLENDINATSQDWIIVIFHHPPYTKGSHDSDDESHHIEMRENVLPILEAGGVDLVLGGHSHNYERSYLLNGHYDYSWAFQSWMKKNSGDGKTNGNGAYQKSVEGNTSGEGAVYVVTGNAGKANSAALNHPAMYYSSDELGSVSLEINGNQLDLKHINDQGVVSDYFTLIKNGLPSGNPPSVSILTPTADQSYPSSSPITITTQAEDINGNLAKVDFFVDGVFTASAYNAPYTTTWTPSQPGSFSLQAKAYDDVGNTAYSDHVNITIFYDGPSSLENTSCPESITVDCNQQSNDAYINWETPQFNSQCIAGTSPCTPEEITDAIFLGEVEGSLFYQINTPKSWTEALEFCVQQDGQLATIKNTVVNDFIRENMNSQTAWIGFSDVDNEGQFQWVNDQNYNYTNWGIWQPSNNNNQEHYVQIAQSNGKWYDKANYPQSFILEIPCNQPQTTAYQLVQTSGLTNGSQFPNGTTNISYQATNECGDLATCSFAVTVSNCPETNDSIICDGNYIEGFELLAQGESSDYYISTQKENWETAQLIAIENNGTLVQINSATENELLTNELLPLNKIAIIGLNDVENEGTLKWSNDTEMVFDQFDYSTNNSSNDYGTLNPWNGQWEFVNSWVEKHFILEIPCGEIRSSENDEQNTSFQDDPLLSISIAPNPVKDYLNIELNNEVTAQTINVEIYHSNGILLNQSQEHILEGINQIQLNTSRFSSGFYILKVRTKNSTYYQTFIK